MNNSTFKIYLPYSFVAKVKVEPACICVAPLLGPSKNLRWRGTISSFGSAWPSRPYPPNPQVNTLFFESMIAYKRIKMKKTYTSLKSTEIALY